MKPATVLIILALVVCSNAQQGKSYGVLNGKVVDVAGAPVRRTSVTVRSPTTKDFQILTGEDGRFLAALPFGKYELLLTCAGFQPLERTVNIEAGRNPNVEFVLQISSNAFPDPMVDSTPAMVRTVPSKVQDVLPERNAHGDENGDDPCPEAAKESNAAEGQCYAREQLRVNAEADALVDQAVAALRKGARDVLAGKDFPPESATLLQNAAVELSHSQARWREYRDKYCQAVKHSWTFGSGAGIAYERCLFELGRSRVRQLGGDFPGH